MLRHSDLLVGLVDPDTGSLVAFARVLLDFSYFAMIFDVIVDESARGHGLGDLLLQACWAARNSKVSPALSWCANQNLLRSTNGGVSPRMFGVRCSCGKVEISRTIVRFSSK
jgi:GNAT superfamily N-acetyltransferase